VYGLFGDAFRLLNRTVPNHVPESVSGTMTPVQGTAYRTPFPATMSLPSSRAPTSTGSSRPSCMFPVAAQMSPPSSRRCSGILGRRTTDEVLSLSWSPSALRILPVGTVRLMNQIAEESYTKDIRRHENVATCKGIIGHQPRMLP
jgi:hypothetical protein